MQLFFVTLIPLKYSVCDLQCKSLEVGFKERNLTLKTICIMLLDLVKKLYCDIRMYYFNSTSDV